MSDKVTLMVDPPEGWRYGFPKLYFKNEVTDNDELCQWLLDNGYPARMLAQNETLRGVRMWGGS